MSTAWDRIVATSHASLPPAPGAWHVECVDMHTGGEPLRVILAGGPTLSGRTVLECRREMLEHHDDVRRRLMWEPRGHADMYGLLPIPPERPDSDFGVLFLHNDGYSTMCGHATIAIAKLAVELGWVEHDGAEADLRIDAPCGQLRARVSLRNGRVDAVRFVNVPSFVVALDETVTLDGGQRVSYDLAYGGAFYAYVEASQLGLPLAPEHYGAIIREGRAVKRAVMASRSVEHPFEADLGFLYGTIFIAPSDDPAMHSRNVCVFAEGEVDRSPTGSGVSGRAAIHHARGDLTAGETIRIESIVGSVMGVTVVDTCAYGPHAAVIPEVSGSAWITGRSTFVLDPDDPFAEGFFLR
jgi:trans-L-3-hydroxyproline dehydratase